MRVEDIYPAYNARHLLPNEVGESFIWSSNFEKLIQNCHSVILGARGCGKTTLMKMLTLPALNSWKDERAQFTKSRIPFFAVYISTDIYWDVKNQIYGSQLNRFGKFEEIISNFSVNSNVFTSLCDTFQYILNEYDLNDETKEIELSKTLIRFWQLEEVIPKLSFVKEALINRIDKVNQLVQNLIFNYTEGDAIPHPSFFNLNFETSIEAVIPVFERIYDLQGRKKWALCFDELEFAPLWLQKKLFRSLRSRKQYILYKLSSSPILSLKLESLLSSKYAATSGNDMQIIKMWNSSDNETFSAQIINSLLTKKFPLSRVTDFFGTNEVYNSSNLYSKNSKFYKKIIRLASKDPSFKKFLIERGINPRDPDMNNQSMRDTVFRKIKPIVYFRDFFIDEINNKKLNKVSYRSRKKAIELFSGVEVLAKICDGNPRWLIGIITGILQISSEKGAEKRVQYDEVHNAALRFKNIVGNIPIGLNASLSLIDVIERIGQYFEDQVLGDKFLMDPRGTFEVDDDSALVADDLIFLLEKAISQGAIILINSKDDNFDFKIRGKKFKLSYLLSLLYRLPLRNYPDVKLSKCVAGIKYINQKTLFD